MEINSTGWAHVAQERTLLYLIFMLQYITHPERAIIMLAHVDNKSAASLQALSEVENDTCDCLETTVNTAIVK